jgi:nitronate monooxygenase
MQNTIIPPLVIGDITAKIPIIQGGMGVGVSLSGLASAVANEGGIGVIAAAGIGMHEPDFNKHFNDANKRGLAKEIQKTRSMTNGIIGVNVMLAHTDFDELVSIAVGEGADLVLIGAGLALKNPVKRTLDALDKVYTKVIPIVSSARAARIIFEYWHRNYEYIPDAVVVEGPLAGGHLGFKKEQLDNPEFALEKILVEVIHEVNKYSEMYQKPIPVIAAGGIYTGSDMYKFMQLGASGVQMATRFVATHECDASDVFKNMYLNCKEEDLIIVQSPVGLPGRAIRNKFLDEVEQGLEKPFHCPWHCLIPCDYTKAPYCIALALISAKKGNLDEGFTFAGSNAYRIDKIISVKELIDTLLDEYKEEAKLHM